MNAQRISEFDAFLRPAHVRTEFGDFEQFALVGDGKLREQRYGRPFGRFVNVELRLHVFLDGLNEIFHDVVVAAAVARAFARALLKAGNSMAANIAMIAMTTSNSIKVNFLLIFGTPLYL